MENTKNQAVTTANAEKSYGLLTDSVLLTLLDTTKSTICAVEYIVDESQSRTIGGKKALQKHVKVNQLFLNHDYAKKVQKISGDTDFQAFELKGKERLSGTILQSIATKELLLDGKILNSESVTRLNFLHEGEEISEYDAIEQNLFAPAYFKKDEPKQTSGRGILTEDEDFKMITLGLKKIVYIKIFGQEYKR
jgi:hypothetical protein